MASFNRVILLGNLTRDPQVRYTPGGTAVSEIGLAVNRTWFDQKTNSRREEVTFVDVTLWGRQAEVAGEYLSKGRQVLIEGRLQLDTWEDKESGQKRSKLRVVCENMTMVGGPRRRVPGRRDAGQKGRAATAAAGRGAAGRRRHPATESQAPPDDFQDAPQEAPPGRRGSVLNLRVRVVQGQSERKADRYEETDQDRRRFRIQPVIDRRLAHRGRRRASASRERLSG